MPPIYLDVRGIADRIADEVCTNVKVLWLTSSLVCLCSCPLFTLVCISSFLPLLFQMKMPPLFDDVISSRRPLTTGVTQQHVYIDAYVTRRVITFATHEPRQLVQEILVESIPKTPITGTTLYTTVKWRFGQ